MKIPKLEIIIFDMDGTVINSMPLHAQVFSEILKEKYNIPIIYSKKEYFKSAGAPLDEQFSYVAKLSASIDNISACELKKLSDNFWEKIKNSKPKLFTDTICTLNKLKEEGYILILVSSCSPDVVFNKVEKTNIGKYFKLILGTDKNIKNMVKGEGHFQIIRENLGISSSRFCKKSALIGDGPYDMVVGKKADILTIGKITDNNEKLLKREGADLLINNLNELIPLLQVDKKHINVKVG